MHINKSINEQSRSRMQILEINCTYFSKEHLYIVRNKCSRTVIRILFRMICAYICT